MRHVRAVAVLAAAAALAVPAAASADTNPTRVAAPPSASWVTSSQINVEVTLTCEEGVFYSIFARVLQQQGPFTQVYGEGATNGRCAGRHQRVALSIWAFSFPGWQLGDAILDVSACAFTCDSTARSIRIAL
jgi:hypothetical protein